MDLSSSGDASKIRPISLRKRDGSNLLFFDARAEWMSYASAMQVLTSNPQYRKYGDTDEDGRSEHAVIRSILPPTSALSAVPF